MNAFPLVVRPLGRVGLRSPRRECGLSSPLLVSLGRPGVAPFELERSFLFTGAAKYSASRTLPCGESPVPPAAGRRGGRSRPGFPLGRCQASCWSEATGRVKAVLGPPRAAQHPRTLRVLCRLSVGGSLPFPNSSRFLGCLQNLAVCVLTSGGLWGLTGGSGRQALGRLAWGW